MRLDKDKIKESLTENDIELILMDLGSDHSKRDTKGNLLYQTVCHSGHKHKLYYYKESQIFQCYTDCQESFDIYELVSKVKKISFPASVKYVGHKTGKLFTSNSALREAENNLIDDWKWISKYKKREKPVIELPTYSDKVLDVFIPYPHEDWLIEGISYETLQKYNVSYYFKDEKIVIPHYDLEGNLIGLRGRAMLQEDVESGKKYMPLIVETQLYNHPTMFNLFGLHKTQEAVRRLKKAAIFESEKSVFKCEDYYGDDNFACATAGGSISRFHRDILLSLGVEEVFICKDKEFKHHESEEAYKYAEQLLKTARLFSPFVKTYILWDEWNLLSLKDSPADRGRETLEKLMQNKFEIKTTEGRE